MGTSVWPVFGQPDISTGDFDSKQIRGRKYGLQRITLLRMAGYTKKVLLNSDSCIRTTSLVLIRCRAMSSYTGSRKMGKPPLEESSDVTWIFFPNTQPPNQSLQGSLWMFFGPPNIILHFYLLIGFMLCIFWLLMCLTLCTCLVSLDALRLGL